MTVVLACLAALAVVPAAFAHHGRISGSMDCQRVVSYTASAWQTSNVQAKTHNDVRVYVIQSNGAVVNPAQQVGSGQFTSANGFAFTGTFTVPAGVSSVKLLVKEIGSWANGTASSNGTKSESSFTVSRPTSGCAPPPPQCPTAGNAQVSSSSDIGIANGTATVSFTVAAGCADVKLSLVTYKAPGPAFDANTADQQTVHDSKTVLLAAGNHTLTVAMPDCYYQVDFVYGDVIAKLGPAGSSNFYSAQGRLIKARNGGTGSCAPPPTDECPNIEGNQTSVPPGMSKDASGHCVTPPPPPPTDECPNLQGNQASVPAGMSKDASGHCVSPPPTLTVTPEPASTPLVTATPAAAVVPAIVTPPTAKPAPKAKVTVKKKAKKAKKKIVKKKKKQLVKKQQTATNTKPRALPFTP